MYRLRIRELDTCSQGMTEFAQPTVPEYNLMTGSIAVVNDERWNEESQTNTHLVAKHTNCSGRGDLIHTCRNTFIGLCACVVGVLN